MRKNNLKLIICFLSVVFVILAVFSFVDSIKAETDTQGSKEYSLVSDVTVENPNGVPGVNFVKLIKENCGYAFENQMDKNFCMRTEGMKHEDAVCVSFDEINATDYQKISFSLFVSNWTDEDLKIGLYGSGEKNLSESNAIRTFVALSNDAKEVYLEYSADDFKDENGKISNITFVLLSDNGSNENQIWFNYVGFRNIEKEKQSFLNDVMAVGFHPISDSSQLYIQASDSLGFKSPTWDGITAGGNWMDLPEMGKEFLSTVYLNGTRMSEIPGAKAMMGGSLDLLYIGCGYKAGDTLVVTANSQLSDGVSRGFRIVNEAYYQFNGTSWSMSLADISRITVDNATKTEEGYLRLDLSNNKLDKVDDNLILKQIKLNGKTLELQGAEIEFESRVSILIKGINFEKDDIILIPINTIFTYDKRGSLIVNGYEIGFNGEGFTISILTKGDEDIYVMPENVLSDCSEKTFKALNDGGYKAVQAQYGCSAEGWMVNSASDFLNGGFADGVNIIAPHGANDEGVYLFNWKENVGLLYPSTIFQFTQKIDFDPTTELVARIYVKEDIDDNCEIWLTNCASLNVYDTIKKIPVANLKKGDWTTISVKTKDCLDPDGELKYLCFTIHYPTSYLYENVKGSGIYFDTFSFEKVEKTVQENYTVNDISECLPIEKEGISFKSNGTGNDEMFDYEAYENVAFIRTDASGLNAVQFDLSVDDIENLDFYFNMLGVDLYYIAGGIYYWFSPNSVALGTVNTNQTLKVIDDLFASNEKRRIEIGAIPYFVNMIRAGYFAYVKIDGEMVVSDYYDISETAFGSCFAMYLHTTPKATFKLEPVEYSEKEIVQVTLSSQVSVDDLEVGDSVKLLGRVKGKFYEQSDVEFVCLEGGDLVSIDGDGYMDIVKAGKIRIVARVKNNFGTFESDELEIIVKGEEKIDNKNEGCKKNVLSSECLMTYMTLVMFSLSMIFIKKKEREEY